MTGSDANPEKVFSFRFDLEKLAENGLRRGYTTGTCATAAVKAALLRLVCNETPPEVNVTLPDSLQYLAVAIDRISEEADGLFEWMSLKMQATILTRPIARGYSQG